MGSGGAERSELHAREATLAALGRTLLRLDAAEATGVLRVDASAGGRAEIALRRGRIVYVQGVQGPPLGSLLKLSLASQQEGLCRQPPLPDGVGQWLVHQGQISAGALSWALRRQVLLRTTALAGWGEATLHFRKGGVRRRLEIPEPMRVIDVLLGICRNYQGRARDTALRHLERRCLGLSTHGARLFEAAGAASLGPLEAALMAVLRRGEAPGEEILAQLGFLPAVTRTLWLWAVLGLVQGHRSGQRHGLLLQKRRQLRKGHGAAALLGVANATEASAGRRALRQLVRELHPDRFDAALRPASTEVVRRLVAAEAALRGA